MLLGFLGTVNSSSVTVGGSLSLVAQAIAHFGFNKLTSVSLCVCPVIDHKFRHHIVKV